MPLTTRWFPGGRWLTASAVLAVLLGFLAVGCWYAAARHTQARSVVVVAAGDIACNPDSRQFNAGAGVAGACQQRATGELIAALHPHAVLALGDNQYERGTYSGYEHSYGPTWGRFLSITYPVPGNHEYKSPTAKGYFRYFGSRAGSPGRGYYSFDLGAWHLIALNSQCRDVGGCGRGSPQERWLRSDLAANRPECVLAYWHEPRFSSGPHGTESQYDAFWRDLYAAHADVVLNGHDHDYERFAPLDPEGRVDDARGIRQFVAGTGGAGHHNLRRSLLPGTEVANDQTFGLLELTLLPGEYRWRFVPVKGDTFTDSGSGSCH